MVPVKADTSQKMPLRLLTMFDIASLVGVSMRTVTRWRSWGFLPKPDVQRGAILRWSPKTIERWIAKNK